MSLTTSRSQKQGTLSTQGDHQTQFYDYYRKVAEEYDKDFLKRYGEDLDTTLIFVGYALVLMNHADSETGWSVLSRRLCVYH